jgi:hypothetical protein
MGYSFHFCGRDYYPNILKTEAEEAEPEPEPKINLENEIGKLLETLVTGLTGKSLDEQGELVTESLVHVSTKLSKSNDTFRERLANESEDHMLKIVKAMMAKDEGDTSLQIVSMQAILWKLRKLNHVVGRFEDILYDEMQLRKNKDPDLV